MKRYFITGLLIWVPLAITAWVLVLIVGTMDQSMRLLPAAIPEFPVFNAKFDPKTIPPCGHDKPDGKPGHPGKPGKPDHPTSGKR